jgi:hypothetical protein
MHLHVNFRSRYIGFYSFAYNFFIDIVFNQFFEYFLHFLHDAELIYSGIMILMYVSVAD